MTCAGRAGADSALGAAAPPGEQLSLDLGNGTSMKLVKIAAGAFTMGVPADAAVRQAHPPVRDDEHEVTIAKDFWIGVTEVTQAQYEAIMGDNPSKAGPGADLPVNAVSFVQAQAFCKELSDKTGSTVRIPTDEEWEYAARAGGDGLGGGKATDVAWCKENSDGRPHAVAGKVANAWGLHDTLGNVSEWVTARKGVFYMGGNWSIPERFTIPPFRQAHGTTHSSKYGGFRVVVEQR